MKPKIFTLIPPVLAGFLAVGSTLAQDFDRRGEVYGVIGYGGNADDEGGIGKGVAGGGSVGWRVTPRFGVEFDVNAYRHVRDFGGNGRFSGRGEYYTGNLLWHFSRGRIQPYVVGGAGALRHTLTTTLSGPGLGARTISGFALDLGFGVKGFISDRWSIRPEVRGWAGGSGVEGGIEAPLAHGRISIGIGYHW